MSKLDGKIALVTGGSTGIGLATAQRLVADGAYVFITGRRQAELDSAVKAIGKNARGIVADSAKGADLDKVYGTIKAEKGKLDIVFANAGVADTRPLVEVDDAHFEKHFGINVKGVLFTVQKALPILVDGGAIILNGSIVGSSGNAGLSVYSATKAAIRSFARSWTLELKDRKIRVNVVSPGPIQTPGLAGLAQSPAEVDKLFAYMASTVPLGRLGQPDEIARAVSFLASDDASFIAGVELFVDGGVASV